MTVRVPYHEPIGCNLIETTVMRGYGSAISGRAASVRRQVARNRFSNVKSRECGTAPAQMAGVIYA